MPKVKEVTKVVRLSHIEYFKVCRNIEARKNEFEQEKWSYTKVAEELTKELGFDVTPTNVLSCAKDLDMRWFKDGGNTGGNQMNMFRQELNDTKQQLEEAKKLILTFGVQLDDAVQKNRKLQAEVDLMRGALNKLYRDLGNTPPAGYPLSTERQQAILNGK